MTPAEALAKLGAELSACAGTLPDDRERTARQVDLARKIGFAVASVRRVLGGAQRPSARMLALLGHALGAAPETRARWEALRVATLPLIERRAAPVIERTPRTLPSGVCHCGATANPGRVRCEECLATRRVHRARSVERRAAAGLCVRCPHPARPATCGDYCDEHHESLRAAARRAYIPTGHPVGRPRSPHAEQWAELARAGAKPVEIARATGAQLSSVYSALKRRGLYQPNARAA